MAASVPFGRHLGILCKKKTNKTTTKVHFYYSPQTISNQSPCSVYFQNAVMIHEWCSQPQRNYCTDSYKQYYLMLFNIIKSICACKQLWGHRMSHSICFPHAAAMLICSKCSSLSRSLARSCRFLPVNVHLSSGSVAATGEGSLHCAAAMFFIKLYKNSVACLSASSPSRSSKRKKTGLKGPVCSRFWSGRGLMVGAEACQRM